MQFWHAVDMPLLSVLAIGGMARNGGAMFLAALWGFSAYVFQGMSGPHAGIGLTSAVLWLLCGAALGSLAIELCFPKLERFGQILFWIAAAPIFLALLWYVWPG